jgi:hypothetical protein
MQGNDQKSGQVPACRIAAIERSRQRGTREEPVTVKRPGIGAQSARADKPGSLR